MTLRPGVRVRVVQHPNPLVITPHVGSVGVVIATYEGEDWADVRLDLAGWIAAFTSAELTPEEDAA